MKKPDIKRGQKLITHSGEELMFIDWLRSEEGKMEATMKVTAKDRGVFPISLHEIRTVVEPS